MSPRAERKKLERVSHVGQRITWGRGVVSYAIVEKRPEGVVVDLAGDECQQLGTPDGAGRYLYIVTWDASNRGNGPFRLADGTELRMGK